MANKIFNYRYRAQAAAGNYGTGNFNVTDVSGYGSISSLVDTTNGQEQRFAYRLAFTSTTYSNIYEYGIGYLNNQGGGNYQFRRETSLSSSEGDNSKINILNTYGSLIIEIVTPNPNYSNYKRINSNTTLANVNSTYFVDASSNVTLTLPAISTDSVVIGVSLTSLSGTEVERASAVTMSAAGSDTVQTTGTSYYLTQKNDYIRLMSDPDNTNWIVLDPIAEAGASSGPNGAVQLSKGGVISYNNNLFFNDDALFIGGDDAVTAVTQLSVSGTIFNVQSGNIDLTIHGNGGADLLFADASANSIGIRTNAPSDILNINTDGINGITISTETSGSIPTISFLNNDPAFTEGLDVGRIDFIGTNTASEDIVYTRIIAESSDETDGSEEGMYKVLVNNNGSLQAVNILTYNDIQIGPNNSVSGGLIIGANNTNQGDNICIGYYSSNCGISSMNIGHQNSIASGSYAGIIGSHHTVTGSNVWLIGGSGADMAGTNTTFLVGNDNNYIQIKHDQHQRVGIYVDSTGTDFNVVNTRIATSGIEHNNNILFRNTSGTLVTGVSYGVTVLDPSNSTENTEFFVKTLQSGSLTPSLGISANYINISNLSNITDSVAIGPNLTVSGDGSSTTIIGPNHIISNNSGVNTVVGYTNELTTDGNSHIVIVGNSNIADENYSTTIGTSNRNSGLYSAVVGYNNGLYGENISIVGINNSISGNNSSVVGYQNNIDHNNNYIIGQGNSSAYSGVTILGNDVTASGNLITYIKNNQIVITGSYVTFDTTLVDPGSINFRSRPILEGSGYVLVSGDNISSLVNNINYVSSGDNISELVNDVNYVSSGDNVSELVNDVAYLTGIVDDATPVLAADLDADGNGIANLSGISGPSNIISVGSHLVPDTSGTYNLGSSGLPWADLYINTGTIRFVASNGTQYSLGVQDNDLVFDNKVIPDKTEVVLVTGTYTNPSWLNSISSTKLSNEILNISGASGVVLHDCTENVTFLHSNISGGFTANFSSLTIAENHQQNISIFLQQDLNPYMITGVQINSSPQTLYWKDSTIPSGTVSGVDFISLSIIRTTGQNYLVSSQ